MTEKAVAYYHMSTQRQGQSGFGLEAKQNAVQGFRQQRGFELLESFTEVESGKRADRPELKKAISLARSHGAVLVIAKLDRLARNVFFISRLMNAKIKFIACDVPEANEMAVQIMAVMAEQGARAISQRTKATLQTAKARARKFGTSENLTAEAITKSRELHA